jgi:putative hemolysin
MTLANILLIAILITLNAFFVGVEFAVVSSRRSRLDLMPESTSRSVKVVRAWLETPSSRERLIAATQLGITIVSLAIGAVGENSFEAFLAPYFHNIHWPAWLKFLEAILPALPLIISLTVITSLHVILGEQVPKVAVLRSPEKFAIFSAPIMQIFIAIFRGFVDLLDWATRQVLRLLGLPPSSPHGLVYSADELKQMVSGPEVEGAIEAPERAMISAVIDFGDMVVRQIAVPRTEIIAVEGSSNVEEAVLLAAEHSVTKLPVYEEDLDHMTGIVHLRDMVPFLTARTAGEHLVRELVREALFVPETASVSDLLRQFRDRRMHIAIVLDEYGGTAGLVTLDDLLEEIIGVVQDPFENTPPSIQMLPDGSALIDGLTLIDEINVHFGLHLDDPFYDTIAGYVLGKLGRIPSTGDIVKDSESGIHLRVENMDNLRIAQINLRRA